MERYFRQVFTVEVLGNEPLPDDIDLGDLHYHITEGHYSGEVTLVTTEEVSAEEMTALLEAQRSDPDFLMTPTDEED